jgi:hypothetical protein
VAAPSAAPATSAFDEAEAREGKVVEERRAAGGKLSGLELGEPSELGPAGAASASAEGVVMVTRTGEVLLIPTARLKTAIDKPAGDFAATARGPAVADGFAYFVLEGKLARRRIGGEGAVETLADDARNGSRVSALPASGKQPALVAYITRPDKEGTSRAKVWVSGQTLPISVDGAGASSVALARSESAVVVLSIDGRSAMTPVHARAVRLDQLPATAGVDRVVWVAGSAQSLTEITAGSDGKRVWGFLPIEKDVSHFGMAELGLPADGQADADVSWRLYENGIDLAPVAAAAICGSLLMAYARPVEARPHAAQELVLSRPGSNETSVAVTAQGFANVSLAPGLLVYVADRRTFALPLRCKP